MSDAGGGPPAAATPAPTAPQAPAPAGTVPAAGPRRSAPGLSTDRGGLTLAQGVAALRRSNAAPAATPAAEVTPPPQEHQPAAPTEPAAPRRRAAPSQPAPAAPVMRQAPNGAAAHAADGGQQQPRTAAEPMSPLDRIMAAFLPGDGADPPQRQGSEPQPAPTNAYLQGVPLIIEGQQRHFSMPELTEAVAKASDYTNKTKSLAEQQRQLAERAQTIDQLLPILIPEIERQLASMNGADQEPDWIALSADPAEYARQNATWRVRQQQRETERARLTQIQAANAQREEQQRAERVRISHAELVRTLPGWGDANTRNQLVSEMRAWGGQNGFPAAELDSIVEARHITTLTKAMLFDRIMANARTSTLQVPQVRRGATPQAPAPAALRTAEENFNANPTHKAGVGLLLARRGQARMAAR